MKSMKLKNTMESIFAEYGSELYVLRETGDLDDELYTVTFDYLLAKGLIPYGVAKGDPTEYVADFLMKGYQGY